MKTLTKIISTLFALSMLFSLAACGGKASLEEKIIGRWQLTEESESVDQRDFYPEVSVLIFSDDGTWNNEDGNTYLLSENTITMDSRWWVHQYTYSISVEDNILKLQYAGCEALLFEKVK